MSQLKSMILFSVWMALISSGAWAMPTTILVVGPVLLAAPLDADGVTAPADAAADHLQLHRVLDNVWAGDSGSENQIADAADARQLLWHDAKRLDAVTKIA